MIMSAHEKPHPTLRAVSDRQSLLSEDDGSPFEIINPKGKADILLICEHASNRIPASLGTLGLDAEIQRSHVAWDPGAAAVANIMSEHLDAPLILQRFSRLVYDCNRPPDVPSAMPEQSEIYEIPGNKGLSTTDREARIHELYQPFHQAISDHLDGVSAKGNRPSIVTIHSFTPIFHGQPRKVELGLLHDRDDRLARTMLDLDPERDDLDIRLNEPYAPTDGVMHTVQRHALPRGLLNVMIEIRNDLISDQAGQDKFATILSRKVNQAIDQLGRTGKILKQRASG